MIPFTTVRIDATGDHRDGDGKPLSAGYVLMTVDNHGFIIDLSKVPGQLFDRGVTTITWGPGRHLVYADQGRNGTRKPLAPFSPSAALLLLAPRALAARGDTCTTITHRLIFNRTGGANSCATATISWPPETTGRSVPPPWGGMR
jgi:hypothetical protein